MNDIFSLAAIAGQSWLHALAHFSLLDSCRLVAYGLSRERGVSNRLVKLSHRRVGEIFVRPRSSDPLVVEQVFVDRQFDLSDVDQFSWIRERYEEYLRRGVRPVIVDCGANIGLSSVFFSIEFPEASVVAIEPSPENAAVARRNIEGRPRIVLLEAAIHATSQDVFLIDRGKGYWGLETSKVPGEGKAVRSTTIADILDATPDSRALIVKIDIEGSENDLFSGNTEWIDRVDLLIIELHDWLFPGKGTSEPLFRALTGRRFEAILRHENLCFFFK